MLPYQLEVVDRFVKLLPRSAKIVLEIGSDVAGEVASEIARRSGVQIYGINSSPDFPTNTAEPVANVKLLQADGRALPFPDNHFDAILTVATMEHVNGLDVFLSEVSRVLKPKGYFFTEFAPLWSSARGHHVFAVVGEKEARFWKPGKNPIPDYGHLLMTPDEMRDYLRSGPCSEELIEPIINWIYIGNNLNRCHFNEYLRAFEQSPMLIQRMKFTVEYPESDMLLQLSRKFGNSYNFTCAGISCVMRKPPKNDMVFRWNIACRKICNAWLSTFLPKVRLLIRICIAPFVSFSQLFRSRQGGI